MLLYVLLCSIGCVRLRILGIVRDNETDTIPRGSELVPVLCNHARPTGGMGHHRLLLSRKRISSAVALNILQVHLCHCGIS
jgi:hypothetical protein